MEIKPLVYCGMNGRGDRSIPWHNRETQRGYVSIKLVMGSFRCLFAMYFYSDWIRAYYRKTVRKALIDLTIRQ